jgi:hypothetical protein
MSNLADWTFLDASYRRGLAPEPRIPDKQTRRVARPPKAAFVTRLRSGPRAQFERRRDEFLPRDLRLLHAAGRYTM